MSRHRILTAAFLIFSACDSAPSAPPSGDLGVSDADAQSPPDAPAIDAPASTFDRAIDTHVKNLRRKMSEVAPEGPTIRSVYGVGYKLE